MNNLQRLGIMQALYNQLGRELSTRGDGNTNLRHRVDRELLGYHSATGAKSFDINLGEGETLTKIGTASVRVSKAESRDVLEVTDGDAFGEWLMGDGNDYLLRLANEHAGEVLGWAQADGVLPDGCEMVRHSIPPVVTGTTIRVDPQCVAKAVSNGAVSGRDVAQALGVAPLMLRGE